MQKIRTKMFVEIEKYRSFDRIPSPGMIEHNNVEPIGQLGDIRMSEFVQRPLVPVNANIRIELFKSLRRGHQRRQRAAVIPCNSPKLNP